MSSALIITIVGIAVGAIVVVVLAKKLMHAMRGSEIAGTSRQELTARWAKIEQLAMQNDEMSGKMALMEADKFFDLALKMMMFSGDTMGERMKVAGYKFPKMQDAWQAHILRNKMVHDAQFSLRPDSARRAVGQYKNALKQMNVL
ncbi:MAG: hypothetical protein Q8P11_02735 [bacterium]|nr:hypothetical protein [bacterium]